MPRDFLAPFILACQPQSDCAKISSPRARRHHPPHYQNQASIAPPCSHCTPISPPSYLFLLNHLSFRARCHLLADIRATSTGRAPPACGSSAHVSSSTSRPCSRPRSRRSIRGRWTHACVASAETEGDDPAAIMSTSTSGGLHVCVDGLPQFLLAPAWTDRADRTDQGSHGGSGIGALPVH
jgi:hypothetical protein